VVELLRGVAGIFADLAEHDARRLVAGGELGATLDEAADLVQREETGERPADAERDGTDPFQCPLDQADVALALLAGGLERPREAPELTLGEVALRPQALHPG